MAVLAQAATDSLSTRWIGYSDIHNAWGYFIDDVPNPERHELLWFSGGAVDKWRDPNHVAWAGTSGAGGALVNPTAVRSGNPDRVVYCVSGMSIDTPNDYPPGGYNPDVAVWVEDIQDVVDNIRAKYPHVKEIFLQPPIYGPAGALCTGFQDATFNNVAPYYNRQTFHAPRVYSAIGALCKGNVRLGFVPVSPSCDMFADWAGHQTTAGEQWFAQAMADWISSNR